MLAPRIRGALVFFMIGFSAAVSACHSSTEPSTPSPARLSVPQGNYGLVGTSVPLTVTVYSSQSDVLPNVTVVFQVTRGTASVSPSSTKTDANGQAKTTLTYGSTAGEVDVTVTVQGTTISRVINAAAMEPLASCNASTALALAAGEVRTPVVQLGVCLSGGTSGAEFALVPFNNSTTFASIASVNFVSSGVTSVTGPVLAQIPAGGLSASLRASPAVPSTRSVFTTDDSFDGRLRESERRLLTPLIPAARAWRNSIATGSASGLRPSFSASPLVVGQQIQLNVHQGPTMKDACETPDMRTGRVVALTERAAIVADINNPAGGFTDAEYQSIGVTFDTLVYSMDTQNFGTPSDIDSNGRVLMFFTRAVNELTPSNSGSIVGGFFYGRDLFPKTATASLEACPTSNVAEMFYLLVPDPNGVVNNNARTKALVSRLTIGTTAHEFQHLINGSRRVYVNEAQDFEEVWLNEGLSHIAEELLFYRESAGLTPRMNLDGPHFATGHQQDSIAFFNDQVNNFLRYRSYLQRPSRSSPYAPDDSLFTRGATWSFLRYAADQHGTTDGNLWFQLVNSTATGINNLQGIFGTSLTPYLRDWATSALTDDVPGVGARWQQPSWNQKSMYVTWLQSHLYPLATVTVSDGAPLNVALNGGAAAFVRFSIAAGQVGSVQWDNPPPPTISLTLIRTR